jgi:hypothetical protein
MKSTGAAPPPPHVTRDVLVVQTYAVDGPRGLGISHYQLHLAVDDHAPRMVILTRTVEHYMIARIAEDREQRVDATWHHSQRPNGEACRVLDAITLKGER